MKDILDLNLTEDENNDLEYSDAPDGWRPPVVNTPTEAAYVMERIRRFRDSIAETEAIAKEAIARKMKEIEENKQWLEMVTENTEAQIAPLEGMLMDYIRRRREKDPKYVLKTPDGSAFIKKPPVKWNWPEKDESLVSTLKGMGKTDLINTSEKPNKAAIKTEFSGVKDGQPISAFGEVLTGVTLTDGKEEIAFKFAKKEAAETKEAA